MSVGKAGRSNSLYENRINVNVSGDLNGIAGTLCTTLGTVNNLIARALLAAVSGGYVLEYSLAGNVIGNVLISALITAVVAVSRRIGVSNCLEHSGVGNVTSHSDDLAVPIGEDIVIISIGSLNGSTLEAGKLVIFVGLGGAYTFNIPRDSVLMYGRANGNLYRCSTCSIVRNPALALVGNLNKHNVLAVTCVSRAVLDLYADVLG